MGREVTDLDRYRRERLRKKKEDERRLARFRRIDERARRFALQNPGRPLPQYSWARGIRWWVAILAALLLLNLVRMLGAPAWP